MIVIITSLVFMIVAFVLIYREFEEVGISLMLSLFIGFLGMLVGMGISSISSGVEGEKEYVLQNSVAIEALNDGTEVKGKKYLFSGYIDENLMYRYVYRDEIGMRVEEIPAKEAVLIYDDTNPRMEIYIVRFVNPIHRFFSLPFEQYRFYVPEGTITTEYSVDLQ